MIGRISRQKGVNFFIDTVKYFKDRKDRGHGRFLVNSTKLKSQNIKVTGFLK